MWWSITIILVLVIILILYKWSDSNTKFTVIGECVYKDKVMFSDALFIKNSVYTIRYDFKDGRLCAITAHFYDKSVLYTFAPYWQVYCYGRNGEPVKVQDFLQLYIFDTDPNSVLKLLTKKYKDLDKLPKLEQKSPDVSGRFVF